MGQDTITYDSIDARPLPRWLTSQRDGLNTYRPPELTMKDDHSLAISFLATGAGVILTVALLTLIILRKKKK